MIYQDRPFVALLVTCDTDFKSQVESMLREQFEIRTHCFGEHDIRKTLHITKPLVILWDGRNPNPQSRHLLQWLREHFTGCPILALLSSKKGEKDLNLSKQGINLLLDSTSPSFLEDLRTHIGAVIMDSESLGCNTL